jgi:general secretion pathway protein F
MQFLYRSISPEGHKQSGMVEASSLVEARRLINAKGETLLDLRATDQKRRFQLEKSNAPTIQLTGRFAGELAPLLNAGAPLRQALSILSEGTGKTSSMARDLADGIDRGERLSSLITAQGGSAILLGRFIEAGEKGAGLAIMCERAASFLNTRAQAAEKIRSVLAYPIFVLLLAFAAAMVIILFVAPALAPALAESENGGLIRGMADFGQWLNTNSIVLLIGWAGLIAALYVLRKPLGLNERSQSLIGYIPGIRVIREDLSAGPAAEVLGALIEAGTPVADALDTASNLATYPASQAFKSTAERIRDGMPVGSAFSKASGLPLEILRLAQLGERTGGLGPSLAEAGRLCQARALASISRSATIAGPALVVIIGGLVAVMMLLVLSGLTSIGEGAL